MKTSVEKLEGDRVRITMNVSAAEVDEAVKDAYSRASRSVKIQGFRPGKAPRNVVDTHVGRENVLADALQELVDYTYASAVEEHVLLTTGRPETGELEALEEGKDYEFSAEVDLQPEFDLLSFEELEASLDAAKASDEDIDAELEYLRDRHATLEVVEGRGVAADDFVLLSFTGTVDGETAEDLVVDKFLYEMGKGIMPAEFDTGLIGANAGDSVHVEFVVPDTAANEFYRGLNAAFEVEVHEIKAKILPALDDEFAANVGGFETLEDLRTDVAKKFITRRFEQMPRLMERAAFDVLGSRLEGEIPKELINGRARTMTDEFFRDLDKRGISVDEYYERTHRTADDVFEETLEPAETSVRDELALEALYRQAGLEYSADEMEMEIGAIAESEKTSAKVMKKRLLERGIMPLLRKRLRQRTAAKWLLDNIKWVQPEEDGTADGATGEKKPAAKKAAAKKTAAKKPASDGGAATEKKASAAGKKDADKPAKKAPAKKKDA